MSKARKRMIVRLSIVSAVVGLGVFALVQAQMRDSRANDDSKTDAPDNFQAPPAPETTNVVPPANDSPFPVAPVAYTRDDAVNPAHSTDPPADDFSTRGGEFGGLTAPTTVPALLLPMKQEPPADTQSPSDHGGQFADSHTPLPETTRFQSEDPETDGASGEFQPYPDAKSFAPPNFTRPDGEFRAEPTTTRQFEGDAADAYDVPGRSIREDAAPPTTPRRFEAYPEDREYPARAEPRTVTDPAGYGQNPQPTSAPAYSFNSGGTPGPQHLEGVRTPSLVLEKRAPQEIQVGKSAVFEIHVQNAGRADANNVVVVDQVPRGTEFVDASPAPEQAPGGQLLWQLGTLRPGDEKTISIQLMPTDEGEVGSVARVAFETEASVKTICTRPQLAIVLASPPRVLIGENITHTVKISNPGTGDATGVILEEDVPDGFSHPAGNELEFEIGTLRPGESREVKLTLKAEQAGNWENVLHVRGDGNLVQEDVVRVEVIAPELTLVTRGPAKRYLERPATYEIHVDNPGTAPAKEIELVAFLHKGMKFVETNNHGQYDPQHHAVYWSLEQLPAQEQGAVEVTVLPIETGEQRLRVEGRAGLGLEHQQDHLLQVEGLAALFFDVADVSDPIEVGSDTVYHVRVLNQGSKTATNVQVVATVPGGMQPIGGDGPTRSQTQGQVIAFEPLSRLAPKSDVVFKIQVRGLRPGDQRIKVQLTSDDFRTPITKEESTRVYSDR